MRGLVGNFLLVFLVTLLPGLAGAAVLTEARARVDPERYWIGVGVTCATLAMASLLGMIAAVAFGALSTLAMVHQFGWP